MKMIFSFLLIWAFTFNGVKAQTYSWVQAFSLFLQLENDLAPVLKGDFAKRESPGIQGISLKTFPNPAREWVVVSSPEDMEHIALFDSSGNLLFVSSSGRTIQKIDLSVHPAGTYWIRVASQAGGVSWKMIQKL
ncbi:MAG: T9SS type A sorting domain-containing protein [Lewinellaceae bacterium]|nr:T9SS type A sorting domain-containing protein [Lewinellaceae bacterium]